MCAAMERACISEGNGIQAHTMMDVNTGKRWEGVLAYAAGKGRQRVSLFLNYCPWCGKAVNVAYVGNRLEKHKTVSA